MFKKVEGTQEAAQAHLLATVKQTQKTLNAKGWIGTVRVGVSIAMIGVHALAPVGGNIRVSESESNPSEKGEGEQMHAAEDGASADGAEGSTEGSTEATKDMHHLEKALGHVCTSIEKTAALWKKHGMGGQVGASITFKVVGIGLSLQASIDVASVKVPIAQ
eukprot:m.50870 g.50870  ORF g.50870 m.50870 type:complete len:162 (+) comp9030_c0_seq1:92-577(+)